MSFSTCSRQSALRAFTLIELLTVIAIIGILAAIIIPVTGKVRHSARNAQCVSYLREWGRAVQLYANDNKGSYFVRAWDTKAGGNVAWSQGDASLTYTYTRYFTATQATKIRQCPLTPTTNIDTEGPTYIMVRGVVGNSLAPADKIPLNLAASPSQYLLLCDSARHSNAFLTGDTMEATIAPMFNAASTTESQLRHKSTSINGVFGDGSIKRITYTPAGQGDPNSFLEKKDVWLKLK